MIKKHIILLCILSCSAPAVYASEAKMESQAEPREVSALKDPSELEVATPVPSNGEPTPPSQEMQTFCPCALKKSTEVAEKSSPTQEANQVLKEESESEALNEPVSAQPEEVEEEYTPAAEVEEPLAEESLME